jgi:hypothetical protein
LYSNLCQRIPPPNPPCGNLYDTGKIGWTVGRGAGNCGGSLGTGRRFGFSAVAPSNRTMPQRNFFPASGSNPMDSFSEFASKLSQKRKRGVQA